MRRKPYPWFMAFGILVEQTVHKLSLIHIEMCIRDRYYISQEEKDYKKAVEYSNKLWFYQDSIGKTCLLYTSQIINTLDRTDNSRRTASPCFLEGFQFFFRNRTTFHLYTPVSYTHLDVYKRQAWHWALPPYGEWFLSPYRVWVFQLWQWILCYRHWPIYSRYATTSW